MPYRVTSDGYDVPGPVGADYFNEQQDAIKQRRLELARMLEAPKTDNGWGGVGAALVRNLSSGYWQGQLDKEERDLSSKRAEAAQKWLDKMPQDTPAQPEFQASIPRQPIGDDEGNLMPSVATDAQGNQPPLGGMVPQPGPQEVYKPATPFLPASLKDTAKWAMEGAGFSPLHGAIALDAYKQANDRKKGLQPKWKVEEIFDKDTGLKRKVLIDENDPSKPPIPVGGTELKEAKDSALTERTKSANEMLRSRFPGKSDDWYKMNAQGLALGDIAIAQDGTIVSKSGAIAGMTGASPVPATGTQPAGATGTKVPPAVQAQRDVGRLGILRQEEADLLAQPDTPQRTQSLAAVRTEIKNMGGAASEAAPADPYAKYRNDPRSKSYLPEPDVPGVIQRGPQTAKADRLNADVQKLGDDYTRQKLPELTTAVSQADAQIRELAAQPGSSIRIDKDGKFSGDVPGFGGAYGIANKFPAMTEEGRAMRLAMEPMQNIMIQLRSGAAVPDQELGRYMNEMGRALNQGDAQFWTAYSNFKERLAKIESGVTSGYAPIVVDAYKAGKGVGGGVSTAPTNAAPASLPRVSTPAEYSKLNVGDRYIDPDGLPQTKKARK